MGISQFPPASGGGLSNDFILNKNNSTNDTFVLPREFEAGGYGIVTSSNDSTFDIYLVSAAGSPVGYSNGSAIVANDPFDTVVIFGIGTAETVQFQYRGPSTNATSRGLEPGAAAYLTSISPFDLQNVNDTATVIGGNFGTTTQITFESGTVVLPAKNTVVTNSTALIVTRPDLLIQDFAPYSLRAVNTGITQPSVGGNVLTGTVTAGSDPTFITPALITGANPGTAFSTSILVSDTDGTVVNWAITSGTIPPGLSLATATGAISGTPTTAGDYFFTVRITDDGNNTNSREFNIPVGQVITGQFGTVIGGTTYIWWTSTGTLTYKNVTGKSLEYVAIAGGGGGGGSVGATQGGGGGGAGGVLTGTITPTGSTAVTVGAAGAGSGGSNAGGDGTNSVITGFATAVGGGGGGGYFNSGQPGRLGGSGGGSGAQLNAFGSGTSGQGNNGGGGSGLFAGGGGGRAEVGNTDGNAAGGDGTALGAWASAVNIIYNAGMFAGGGSGGANGTVVTGGDGGGANTQGAGSANSGGGGGGGSNSVGGNGGSGLVIARFT